MVGESTVWVQCADGSGMVEGWVECADEDDSQPVEECTAPTRSPGPTQPPTRVLPSEAPTLTPSPAPIDAPTQVPSDDPADEPDHPTNQTMRPEAGSHEDQELKDYYDNEELINKTRAILERYLRPRTLSGEAHHRSGPLPPPPKKTVGQSSKASKNAKALKLDEKRKYKTDICHLLFSQESCRETFQRGRSVWELVEALQSGEVSLSAPFLRLTVFETADGLRCIDNRRLFALKEYAKVCGEDRLMVSINLFSQKTLQEVQRVLQNMDGRGARRGRRQIRRNKTVQEVLRFLKNSDNTDGRDVRLRKSRWKKEGPQFSDLSD